MSIKIDSPQSGVYVITNQASGKVYVGCTDNLTIRTRRHELDLRRGSHSNPYLQKAWNKYSEKDFSSSILEVVEDVSNLLEREEFWIQKLGAEESGKGFNVHKRSQRVNKSFESTELNPVGFLKCLILPSSEQAALIEDTLKLFCEACNFINQRVEIRHTHAQVLQSITYALVRERFNLPANLAVRAAFRVSAARKLAKANKEAVDSRLFLPNLVEFDKHTFAFRERDEQVRLTLVGGAQRIPVRLSNYHRGKLKGQKPSTASLAKREDGSLFVNIKPVV